MGGCSWCVCVCVCAACPAFIMLVRPQVQAQKQTAPLAAPSFSVWLMVRECTTLVHGARALLIHYVCNSNVARRFWQRLRMYVIRMLQHKICAIALRVCCDPVA